ncbi:FAD-dependent oxidoreductase [Paenibacillus daejeonensis]|uniref:FAD-dependent oxidoreductase n=1 Tax=Paenibacillus daejeonensis TaxID=135193 RepID=UPI00037FD95A|nr:FAD-dependent oxidoreductase [Paenibacillus daejeonensis]
MKTITMPAREVPVRHEVEVLVVGGGPTGIAAAVAAARNGARTLIVEQRGFLGGMGTVSLVPAFCPYTDLEKPVIRGIGLELLEKMKQRGSEAYRARYEKQLDWVPIDAEALKLVYDDALQESGAQVLYHTFVSEVAMDEAGKRVKGVFVSNKSGTSFIACDYVIDATGDGDIAVRAGARYQQGGEHGELQPGTMCYLLTNVDRGRFKAYLEASGDTHQIPQAVQKAQQAGDLPEGRKEVSGFAWVADYLVGVNFGHVFGIDGTKAEDLTRGAIDGRRGVQVQVAFLRKYVPGFEEAHVVTTGEQIGIRETRRIEGDYTLVQDDFLSMRSFADDIARNSYFIDIHMATSKDEVTIRHLPRGESHGVPYRCLLPIGLDNVWVAGRAASSDRVVQGSLRVMPNCFAMGQAAGTAAYLASRSRQGISTREVPIRELQSLLVQQDAWLGEAVHNELQAGV